MVSLKETDTNPLIVLFEENNKGVLKKSKKSVFIPRQDCPTVYELNAAVYVIWVNSLLKLADQNLNIVKCLRTVQESVDIDDEINLKLAENLMHIVT